MTLVAIACDAGPHRGIGHVMRCLALAEEFAGRGTDVVFVTDIDDVPWAAEQLRRRGFPVHPHPDGAPGLAAAVLGQRPDAAVLDTYTAPPRVSAELRAAGVPLLAIVDGDARGHTADVYVDQNLGAETAPFPYPGHRLAGLRYVLHRDAVRAQRPVRPRTDRDEPSPSVLAHFGGTDPAGAAPVLVQALAATGLPFDATVVAATPALVSAVSAVALAVGQRVTVTPPLDDLPARAAAADLVICASGTSVWEMMCVGAATAITWVADNQIIGYGKTVATRAAEGLGALDEIRATPDPVVTQLTALLRDPARRTALRATAWSLVDGNGRTLVANALLSLLTPEVPLPH